MSNNQKEEEEVGSGLEIKSHPSTSSSITITSTLQPRKVAHRHHHKADHGKVHYRHHHHHRCCDRKKGHSCSNPSEEEEQQIPCSAPHSATFGGTTEKNEEDPIVRTMTPDRFERETGGGGVEGVKKKNDGVGGVTEEYFPPPHTAPLRMMSDPEQSPTTEVLKKNMIGQNKSMPVPSSSGSKSRTSSSTSTTSSRTNPSSQEQRGGGGNIVVLDRVPVRQDTPLIITQTNRDLLRSETMSTSTTNETYGLGKQVFVATNPLLDHVSKQQQQQQQQQQPKVHFQRMPNARTNSIFSSDETRSSLIKTPNQVNKSQIERPTRSPFRLSSDLGSRHHNPLRHDSMTSYTSMTSELRNRDRRISAMIEDCLPTNQQEGAALRKRTNKRESTGGGSYYDHILGFDKMTPGDLIYSEGSKIDGGFGFTIPSGMARESTILLDSRIDQKRNHPHSSTSTTTGKLPSDSTSESSRFSSDTASIKSTISNLLFSNRNGGGDGKGFKEFDQRASTSSFGSSLAASINNRFRRPSSLSDRVNEKDIRPSKLNLNNRKGLLSQPRQPSTISETEEKSSGTWEDVQLDTTTRGKNERLAAAIGVRVPPTTTTSNKKHFSRQDSSNSDLTVIDEEEDSTLEREKEGGRMTIYPSAGYSEREARPTYISGASDSDGFRATMNLPPGLSQADIVAICLVQGMVPPGLPPDDTLVSWSGPLSPTNPRNWSTFNKWYACILVSWSTFLANAATNMIAPALGLMSVEYKILYTMWIRGSLIGSYIFAFTFAPLLFGPMSEIMGRKPVLILGSSLFAIACLLSGYVTAVWQLMILRFLSALGASAPMSIGGAVLTDIFSPDQRGRAMTLFALAPQFGPVLGPVVGGWITQEAKKWRWIFFTAAICGFTAAVPMYFVRESYTPRILANRAKKLRKETRNSQLTTIFERRQETKRQIITRGVVRPLVLFSCEPIVQLLTAYVSLIYGIIHLMVATFPAVFGTIYSEEPGWASMHFINIGIGTIAGGFAGGYLVEKHYHNLSLKNRGVAKPEFKFYCMLYTVWIPPFGLMIYGVMTWFGIHWIFADIGIFIFCFGISVAVVAVQSYMVDCYALLAGSALTATIVFRSIVGTGATIGSEDLLLHAGMLWSNVALAGACILIGVPCAYAVYFLGPSMRQKSRHATHKR